MLKPVASSSSSARFWAVIAAALILCAANVELVHGGGRPVPRPPAPVGHVAPKEHCPDCSDNPPPSPPPLPPTPPAAAAGVPPASGHV
ncbi:unnamed protein product [Triticum turgidum subsp. durum]|uniref:Uncharacterized protein n=2 Tax=Triticum TaxID=4564 RepID=A0A9R1Q643_TRITD|nr:unnamed protein product [Triticum aestivum]VAH70755.1 unnamed protein product [Triticum turgidum subsp. durum]